MRRGPPRPGRLSVLCTRSRVVHGPAGSRIEKTLPVAQTVLGLGAPTAADAFGEGPGAALQLGEVAPVDDVFRDQVAAGAGSKRAGADKVSDVLGGDSAGGDERDVGQRAAR